MNKGRENGGVERRKAESPKALGREEGIPWIWLTGGALVTVLLMIICLLAYIFSMGAAALWPRDLLVIPKEDPSQGVVAVGVYHRTSERTRAATSGSPGETEPENVMIYQANQDFSSSEFVYTSESAENRATKPKSLWYVERREWGPFIGTVERLGRVNEQGGLESFAVGTPQEFLAAVQRATERRQAWLDYEEEEIRPLNHELEDIRIELRRLNRLTMSGKEVGAETWKQAQSQAAKLTEQFEEHSRRLRELQKIDESYTVTLRDFHGEEKTISLSGVTRAFQPNQLGTIGKVRVYLDRLKEFVFDEPREANTLGGVFPAIFGTVLMTLIMTVAVLPLGVMAAIYIREIASQGVLVSVVRVAVGNLAGVPSIVYGIFGLGFFCYTMGASIDELLFRDKLPNPTFGTGGILWASLTLALLTMPVVIVSTEEALQSVPRSMREASYGCGATRLQTLLRVVIPKALPGVMTGLILAMARGMGEVAPLLVTGVVKLAPELPLDGRFPFLHLERSFMHLGFHIYDVGFQSRSAEVSRPMVFASTALLVGLVFVLNLVAIRVRTQLRKRFEGRGAF